MTKKEIYTNEVLKVIPEARKIHPDKTLIGIDICEDYYALYYGTITDNKYVPETTEYITKDSYKDITSLENYESSMMFSKVLSVVLLNTDGSIKSIG